jgi:hypothetical protein
MKGLKAEANALSAFFFFGMTHPPLEGGSIKFRSNAEKFFGEGSAVLQL